MDNQQNNTAVTLGLYDQADDGEENYMKSDGLPPNNPPEIRQNRVDIEGDLQGVVRLTPDQLKFLEMVADAKRPAAMLGKLKMAPTVVSIMEDSKPDFRQSSGENTPDRPRQPSVDMQTEIFTPKIKPVPQQLVVKRRDNYVKFARRFVFSGDVLLAKALRPVVIPMHCPRRINIDVIGEKSLGNITEDSMKDSRQLSIESVPADLQQPPTATMPTEIVTPKIKPFLPSIFPRQIDVDVTEENIDRPETATAERVRRRPILALGRRLLKVGRWLCCWCGAYNPRYVDNDDI